MKTPEQRAAKRVQREDRESKVTSWHCPNCGNRHGKGSACPYIRRWATGGLLIEHDSDMGRAIKENL